VRNDEPGRTRLVVAHGLPLYSLGYRCLSLHWVSFDALFESMPQSHLAAAITSFRDRFDRSRDAG
jgi:hypothetical protein